MSILGALGSALSMGMIDMYNTYQTNESNERINNYTLRQQKELYEDQKNENRFLVDQAYERNLPKNVKKNLIDAGINPAYAMDAGSFGSASAQVGNAPSAPSLPQAHPAVKSDAAAIMGQGISDAFNQYLAEKQQVRADKALNHQIAMDRAENDMKFLDLIDRIHSHGWSNAQIQANTAKVLDDLNYARKTEGERARGISLANANLEADKEYKETIIKLNNQAHSMNIDAHNRAWIELSQFIAESSSRISLNTHLGQMYDSQRELNYSQQDVNIENWKDKKFYNSKIEEIYKNNKGQADAMLRKLNYETSVQGWKDFVRMFQGFIPFGGMYQ